MWLPFAMLAMVLYIFFTIGAAVWISQPRFASEFRFLSGPYGSYSALCSLSSPCRSTAFTDGPTSQSK